MFALSTLILVESTLDMSLPVPKQQRRKETESRQIVCDERRNNNSVDVDINRNYISDLRVINNGL